MVRATQETYRQLSENSIPLDALCQPVENIPTSVAFLAVSVLAAYHMETDKDHTARAYYPRLAKLLDVNLSSQGYPRGFDVVSFENLWLELAKWLKEGHERILIIPSDRPGTRRYIAYPLAHVPLRQVDLDRLPEFFASFGFEPGSRPPIDKLKYNLVTGGGAWSGFTRTGRQGLQDEKLQTLLFAKFPMN